MFRYRLRILTGRIHHGNFLAACGLNFDVIDANTVFADYCKRSGRSLHCFGYLSLPDNQRVRIEIDGEAVDRYGRQLVFVWHNDRLLNEELVRQGLARAKLAYDYSEPKKQRLRAAEDEAQRSRLGIWSR